MKTLAIAAIIALSATAGIANAASDTSVTRTQVVAELQQARAQGLLSTGEEAYPVEVTPSSAKSRADVLAELQSAEQAGQVSVGEDPQYPALADSGNATRAQVLAELHQYAESHNGFVGA